MKDKLNFYNPLYRRLFIDEYLQSSLNKFKKDEDGEITIWKSDGFIVGM